jgi:hypothetical protein
MEPAKIVPTHSGFARFMAAGHMRGTGPFILAMVTAGYLFRGILKPQDYSAVSSKDLYSAKYYLLGQYSVIIENIFLHQKIVLIA